MRVNSLLVSDTCVCVCADIRARDYNAMLIILFTH